MDYVPPAQVLQDTTALSQKKVGLSVGQMMVRGFMSGAFLGFATAVTFKATAGLPENVATIVNFAIFPIGFVILTIFALELATGSFGIFPIGLAEKRITWQAALKNLCIVYLANFVGAVVFGVLFAVAITEFFGQGPGPVGDKIISVAQSKTLTYEDAGLAGWATALTKGILCNWMVATGAIIALTSKSTIGKLGAIWLPIGTFFALGLEHCIVNMFIIPSAMMLGADISWTTWMVWNQIPVTIGNLIGGAFFAGMLFYWAYRDTPGHDATSSNLIEASKT